jgi:hypothetical protein
MCAACGCNGAIPRAESGGFPGESLTMAGAVAVPVPTITFQDRYPWWLVVLAVALLITHK